MSRFNTGNPLGSGSPLDLDDNAKNLDVLTNSREALSNPDRFGVQRKTWHGMEIDFDNFLQASGYQDLGEYAPGIEITAHNQYVTFDGQPYLLKPSIPVPYTTSGVWTGDDFKLIGDDALRQDLANPDKGAAMVAYGESSVKTAIDGAMEALSVVDGESEERELKDVLVQIMTRDRVNAAWYGLNELKTPAVQRAGLIAAGTQAKLEGKRLWVPKGHYQFDGGVQLEVPIECDGGVLDFSGGSDFSGTGYAGLVFAGGGNSALPALASDVEALSSPSVLTFVSPPAVSAGDVICIYNPTASSWSTARASYNAGEFATVLRVSGSTVELTGPLFDSYVASEVQVYRQESLRGAFDFNGAEIIGPPLSVASGSAVTFRHLNRAKIYGLSAMMANYAQIGIVQSVDVDLYGCNANLMESVLPATAQYGLSYSNSQSVRAHGGSFTALRHGVTMGGSAGIGAVPTRDCHVFGALISGRGTGGGDNGADFHGNVEHSSYQGCRIIGGGTFGGNNNSYKNNDIVTGTGGIAFYSSEPKGHAFDFIDNNITVRGTLTPANGVFYAATFREHAVLGGTLNIKGMIIKGADIADRYAIDIANNGSPATGKHIAVSDLHMDAPGALGAIRVRNLSGVPWDTYTGGIITNTGPIAYNLNGVTARKALALEDIPPVG